MWGAVWSRGRGGAVGGTVGGAVGGAGSSRGRGGARRTGTPPGLDTPYKSQAMLITLARCGPRLCML